MQQTLSIFLALNSTPKVLKPKNELNQLRLSPKQQRFKKSIAAYQQSMAEDLHRSDQARVVNKVAHLLKKSFTKKHKSLSIDVAKVAMTTRAGGQSTKQPFSGHNSSTNSGKVSPPAIKFPKLSKQQDFLNSPIAITSDHQTFVIPSDVKP